MIPEKIELRTADAVMELPLMRDEGLCLYALNLMGKGRLNRSFAKALADQLKSRTGEFDVIVAVEAKSLALVQEMSQFLNFDEYVVLRKSHKLYMGRNALKVDSGSITTMGQQQLWLDEHDIPLLTGKRILFVDDVISTGKTKAAADELFAMVNATVTVVACVATEGKASEDQGHGWVRLGHIPLYDENENPL